MVDEFEFNALAMELHLLRAMNRMLDKENKRLKSQTRHPAGKERREGR